MSQLNRVMSVYYDGYKNNGSTAIDADLSVGACVCTVEGASSIHEETGLQRVTRPETANLTRAKKYIVADSSNLLNVNSIPDTSGAPTKRKGGVIQVWNPAHPDNAEVLALVASNVAAGDSLIATYDSFSLSDAGSLDAAILNHSIVGVAREDYSSATTPKKVSLYAQ